MPRNKFKIEYIKDETNRKTTFTRRKKSLMKMVEELSTLCGVEACAIVYGENESQPEVWPPSREAERVLAKFRDLPDLAKDEKMLNQESLTRERIAKSEEKLKKLKRENHEKQLALKMFKLLSGEESSEGMSASEVIEMQSVIDARIEEINSRIATLELENQNKPRDPAADATGNYQEN